MPRCLSVPLDTSTRVGLLSSLFEQQVLKSGDSIAIEFEDSIWTYEDVNRRANQIARFLLDRSYEREDRIGICMDRSATAIISMLGIMKAGCAFVPLDPEFPKDRLAFIVEDASIKMVFCDSDYLNLFETSNDDASIFIDPHDEQLWQSEHDNVSVEIPEDSLAYVMYTSGSTGKPKGVQIEHRALTTYCLADIEVYQLKPTDRTLQFSTLNFDIAIEEIFPPLLVGSVVVVRPRERAETHNELSHLIDTFRITAMHIATAYWHEWVDLLVASHAPVPSSLRLLIATGEKVSVEHFRRWKRQSRHKVLWCNAYGPTETTVTCTVFIPSDDWDEPQMPIGKPLVGYAAHILNDNYQSVGIGETGHLYISGDALARGYLNRSDLTEKAFLDVTVDGTPIRIYRTGDLARWLPSGDIEFSGRVDHQMKIGSYRIEPGEIEAVLSLCASVSESLILCAENAGQKFLAAYVVRKDDSLSTSELAAFLRARLPVYMVPSRFIFLESFPKTINGKIDRRALPPVESGEVDRAGEYQEAESELERELASIWSNVLNISKIGRFDDFFQLGGSSLLVTRVIAQLTGKLNLAIPVRDFFANPTIASLSQHLRLLTQTEKSASSDEEKKLRQANAIALRRKLPTIEPLTIASRSEQLAAVQYPSVGINGMRRNHTIVMCNAMGHEATRANRNLQQLAIRLSQDGFDVVRFDFASTGNSTGRAADATLDQWRSDIAAVVQKIRCEPMFEPSTHNVSLLGIRLGATLLAQTPLTGIDKAILWDPIVSGQDYLNMLRSMHRFELESLTRYLTFRKGQPEQLMGSACTATMQQEIAAIQLCESTRIQSLTRWVVETKRYGVTGQPALSLPGWQHTQSEDEIYWEAKEFSQSSFSSPQSSRLIASIFAKGGV